MDGTDFVTRMRLAREQRPRRENAKWYGSVVEAARAGTASKADAIKAFCILCVGEVKADVTNCTAKSCPLYAYRPYQKGADE